MKTYLILLIIFLSVSVIAIDLPSPPATPNMNNDSIVNIPDGSNVPQNDISKNSFENYVWYLVILVVVVIILVVSFLTVRYLKNKTNKTKRTNNETKK